MPARNIFPLGIIIGGENCITTTIPTRRSAKLSNKWYEFDIGWMYIRILSAFKLAKVKKLAPTPRLSATKPVLDHDTLQAVLSNRYEVMARYGKAVKRAYRQELAKLKGKPVRAEISADARRAQVVPQGRRRPERAAAQTVALKSSPTTRNCAHTSNCARIWRQCGTGRTHRVNSCSRNCRTGCHRAEQSGIKAPQDFAIRLRRYA